MTLELVTPPIGAVTTCRGCGKDVVWDEVEGWSHLYTGQTSSTAPHVPIADWQRR